MISDIIAYAKRCHTVKSMVTSFIKHQDISPYDFFLAI